MSPSVPPARWENFDRKTRDSVIARELRKAGLSPAEGSALDQLLSRVLSGRAIGGKDFKFMKSEGLWEVRFSGDGRRLFRLLYSRESNGVLVLVALRFTPKKSDRLSRADFRTARERLAQWRAATTQQSEEE